METLQSFPGLCIQENSEFILNEELMPTCNKFDLELNEDNDQETVFLDSFEKQDDPHVEVYEALFLDIPQTHTMAVPIDKCPEHMNFLLDMDDKENNQPVVICFENDLEVEGIEREQLAHKDEAYLSLFSHHQNSVTIYAFEDCFAFMLETSENDNLVAFLESINGFSFSRWMSFEIGFKFQFKLPLSNFFCLLKESVSRKQSNNHFLSWLHWNFEIT